MTSLDARAHRDVYELKELHVVLPRIQLTRRKS